MAGYQARSAPPGQPQCDGVGTGGRLGGAERPWRGGLVIAFHGQCGPKASPRPGGRRSAERGPPQVPHGAARGPLHPRGRHLEIKPPAACLRPLGGGGSGQAWRGPGSGPKAKSGRAPSDDDAPPHDCAGQGRTGDGAATTRPWLLAHRLRRTLTNRDRRHVVS